MTETSKSRKTGRHISILLAIVAVVVPAAAFAATLNGTAGDDLLVGTKRADTIRGFGGVDTIFGLGGGDRISGGAGDDKINGDGTCAPGSEIINYCPNGQPRSTRSAFDDEGVSSRRSCPHGDRNSDYCSHDGSDRIYGGSGADQIHGGSQDDRIWGDSGNDHLFGDDDDDEIAGGSGDDELSGGNGSDEISGGPGKDVIDASDGIRDEITCGRGDDTVTADRKDVFVGRGDGDHRDRGRSRDGDCEHVTRVEPA
ncbi:MAG: hypothetical protein QOK16_1013 [Solirubrobacteraceae bacterium]|jgi:Ca2+-binding RTX toxin-like protein|nr:hypothetical protein [Solirubrobacteraceae bacterium]